MKAILRNISFAIAGMSLPLFGGDAQSCNFGQRLVNICVHLKTKIPLSEVFLFSQQGGQIYRYHNSCADEITLIVTEDFGATISAKIEASADLDVPCDGKCGGIGHLLSCVDMASEVGTLQHSASMVGTEAHQPAQATPPPIEASSPPAPTAPATSPVANFTVRLNWDIWGDDIPMPNGRVGNSVADMDNCAAQCNDNPACTAFAFDRWKNVCYPKSSLPESSILDARSIIGIKKPSVLPNVSQTAPLKIDFLPNRRFHDTPVIKIYAANEADCKSACTNELRCVTFTFSKSITSGLNCEMFNVSGAPEQDDTADSGFKYQTQ